ncbi:MAG: ATP-binding cassette domain-containing protein [Tissierellales bacterium]|jgi:sodium transport system ATP-binding protein|nr:ATP-binding cassette domain-containing protein [Tissierellales bacterium]
MIRLENLDKQFKTVKAVDGLTLEVSKGEVFGLLGENGAGKTTTLRLLATMLKPTGGTAIINGEDLVENPDKVRESIGILFGGETGLYDRLSARENIAYFGQLNGMEKEALNARIDDLCKRLGMEEYMDRRAGKFSKGMKQKVAIARSIVHNPPIMLFDEPTSGLDVTAIRVVQEFIKELKNEGKTIIFSSHSMAEVEKLCDRVGVINKGKLVAIGTLEELKREHGTDDLEEVFIRLIGGEKHD